MELNKGDYLYCKNGITKYITCGDGIVGSFDPKRGELYQIIEINKKQLCVKFKTHSIWFTLEDDDDYFCEHYKKYFDDVRVKRKEKLDKINGI